MRPRRSVVTPLLAGYLAVVAVIVLWPSADLPSSSVSVIHGWLVWLGAPRWVTPSAVEFATNVVLFVPLTLLGRLLWPRLRWGWVVVGFVVSVSVELTQLVVLPDRSASGYDVFSNTLGAVVGAVLAWWVLASRRSEQPEKRR